VPVIDTTALHVAAIIERPRNETAADYIHAS
jgi:hypothetical protein